MRPRTDELLRSAVHSLIEHVQPAVRDPLAASYLRTIIGLLQQAEQRCLWDSADLANERCDLVEILTQLSAHDDPATRASADAALAQDRDFEPPQNSLADFETHVAALRVPVSAALRNQVLTSDDLVDYLGHQLQQIERRAASQVGVAI